jgi:hypothetical protein
VKDFPVVVTMDLHGGSQHAAIDDSSKKVLDDLLANRTNENGAPNERRFL